MVEPKTIDIQQRRAAGHLHMLRAKMSGFQALLLKDIESGLTNFFGRLKMSFANLLVTHRRSSIDIMNKFHVTSSEHPETGYGTAGR